MIRSAPLLRWIFALLCGTGSATVFAQSEPPAAPPAETANAVFPLRQLLLGDSVDAAAKLTPVPGAGLIVLSEPLSRLNRAELTKRLQGAAGHPIDKNLLMILGEAITRFMKEHEGYLLVDVLLPPQNISDGTLRLAVVASRVRQIRFQGNRWFSENTLRQSLSLAQGEIIRVTDLDRAINWSNTNPFRRVRIHVEALPNTGEADLVVGVQERLPLRLTATYDNTGNDVLGKNRYGAALTYGNLWGRDHQITYQYSTTDQRELFQAHTFDYRVPNRWRHIASLSGSYIEVAPSFLGGAFSQLGRSISADLKYIVPLSRGRWQFENSATLSFRQSNNNLEYYGTPVLGNTTDTFNLSVGAIGFREDTTGRWIVSANVFGSPGNVNSRNTERVFADSRIGAKPRYAYSQLWVQRLTRLAPGVVLSNRILAQVGATGNLLASDQLSIGGASSVRGYKERIFSGDTGVTVNHEIQRFLKPVSLGKHLPPLETYFLGFWDYGRTYIRRPLGNEINNRTLQSFGVGVRFAIPNRLNGSIDYGRQFTPTGYSDGGRDRLHVRVSMSY